MEKAQIRFKTENFRAVNSADVILNGITVVAGENGCGKSTLSKLLYSFYKSASTYEKLVDRELRSKTKSIQQFLEIVVSEIHTLSNRRNTREEFNDLRSLRRGVTMLNDEEHWLSLIDRIENNIKSQRNLFNETSSLPLRKSERLKYIIKDILQEDDANSENIPFGKISAKIKELYEEASEKIKSRPIGLLLQELTSIYSDSTLPRIFDVYEYDAKLVSMGNKSVSIPYAIQSAIYIDTPMMFGMEYATDYSQDLEDLLLQSRKPNTSHISDVISREIINGNVSADEDSFSSEDIVFKRNDGKIFTLMECATGIKAFAILQLLIDNGCLNDKTLLIIDEPESNLHPQWIIEYARVIVMLKKELGVKFFIASHNPDMVSAIKYISQKEGIDNELNYYLAKKADDYTYNYTPLGTNIDPIFESFNIALERIHRYGAE